MKALILVLLAMFSLPAMATDIYYTPTDQYADGKMLFIVLSDTHGKGCPDNMMSGKMVANHDFKKKYNRWPICWSDAQGSITVYFPHTHQWFYHQTNFGIIDSKEASDAYRKRSQAAYDNRAKRENEYIDRLRQYYGADGPVTPGQ